MSKKILAVVFFSLLALSFQTKAQSLSDLLNKDNISKAVSAVSGAVGASSKQDIVGTWSYSGSAVELKSSNILQNVGGAVATSTIEKSLDKQFTKVGIQKGISTFTFAADSTFTITMKSKTQTGTYSIDASGEKIDLVFLGSKSVTANLNKSGNTMTLTFDADKIVTAVSYISKLTNNSSLNTIDTLLKSYDGVMVGFELQKQQ